MRPTARTRSASRKATNLKSADKLAWRRRSLIDAAIAAIADKGLATVTIADVAREAGCAYGLVSFHFENKQNLLLAALDGIMEQYREAWISEFRAHPSVSAKLEALIDLDFGSSVVDKRYITVVSAYWAEAPRNREYQKAFQAHHAAYMARLNPLIAELAAEEPPRISPSLIARGLSALVDGLWIESQVNNAYSRADWQRSRDLARAYLLAFFPRSFSWRPAIEGKAPGPAMRRAPAGRGKAHASGDD